MDKRSSLRTGEEHSSERLFLDAMWKIKQGAGCDNFDKKR